MEEEDDLTVQGPLPGHVQTVPKKEPKEEIRSTSPTANLEVSQLKKEVRSLRFENDGLRRELDTSRENLRISTSAFQGLREHLRSLVDKYTADQGQSEVELQGLDTQAKDIIERIQTVASRLEEDNALLVERLREAIK
ncbi:hypothetical protein M758_12G081100 [Ceratodon purpureus]|uniref:Uncharacterized protein n=1 Tax=Ceratodon purpureus TaxID=3225 RepID=A0A8T0G720_CERPU|nr:hypothetical protein KC19_12G078800 [Ceratodon purpureus]KAG0598518.1 hypothetical protein M758_12G081100 [Ceratodon purpureus]